MKKVEVIEVKKLGRPVNENSVRQQRLKELESKRKNGELKLGRPVNENSERQFRLRLQAVNKQLGIGKGRPIKEDSVRQIRLKELESKREFGLVKRGRPKKEVAN